MHKNDLSKDNSEDHFDNEKLEEIVRKREEQTQALKRMLEKIKEKNN